MIVLRKKKKASWEYELHFKAWGILKSCGRPVQATITFLA